MARLTLATAQQVRAIYEESQELWGGGLSAVDLEGLWQEILRTSWAHKYARFYVWVDGRGTTLSSMKVYNPLVRVNGRCARGSVLAAIFTPRAHRGRGHASSMVRAALDKDRLCGLPLALLFSDIGPEFYLPLGFRGLPAVEYRANLESGPSDAVEGWTLRAARPEDEARVREAYRASSARRPLAIVRDDEHWEFLHARTQSFFSRVSRKDVGHHCRVASHDGRFAGYLTSVEGRHEWNVREIAALDGEPATMAAIFRAGAAHAAGSGLRTFHGWLPPEMAGLLGEMKLDCRSRTKALPMIRPLALNVSLGSLRTPAEAYLPYQDQF